MHSSLQPQALLQRFWGYPEFRSPQLDIIETILDRQDALIVLPTGGGKSLCFQIPALMRSGLTIVISPLVALMENQVNDLKQRKLSAALIHSELSNVQRQQILTSLSTLRLLYLSPETLLSPAVWQRLCDRDLVINTIVIDEAHCLAQWGDTFRPAYFRLGAVRSALLQHKPEGSKIAIAAFTATADPTTRNLIQRILQLQSPKPFQTNPYRPNLALNIRSISTPRERRQRLMQFLKSQSKQSGLIYVRSRQDSETLAQELAQQGYSTAAYHAGLGAIERRRIEQSWLSDRLQFVVCTSAFGMGVDKPNVRWVVHYHAPFLLSEYVQEVGRAGRDGKAAIALTLISNWLDADDRTRWNFFQTQTRSQLDDAQKIALQLPPQGSVQSVVQQFKSGAIALSLLHRADCLTWIDPFHYQINGKVNRKAVPSELRGALIANLTSNSTQPIQQYFKSRECRWKVLLSAFGFDHEARSLKCGKCDRCRG